MSQDDKKHETDDAENDVGASDAASPIGQADDDEAVAAGDEQADGQTAQATSGWAKGRKIDSNGNDEAEDSTEDPRAELNDTKDRLLRAMAETENLRRRAARERADAGKYAISGFARDLLSVIDNLRRALDSLTDELREDGSLSGLISGVEITERELLAAFERHGIRRLDPLGEKFDHNFHQAMFHRETSDQPAGTVVEVAQAGYVIADRLLRPAMVGVAKSPEKTDKKPEKIDKKIEIAADAPKIDTEA